MKRIVTTLNKPNPRIEVVTSASMIPEEVGSRYLGAFGILGCTNIGLMHIQSRVDAVKPDIMKRLRETDGILFTGGDQSRLADFFGNGEFLDICRDRYFTEPDFVIAGTSAGAMAMSHIMIKGGSSPGSLIKGAVKLGTGLGLIHNVIIDSHFVRRGRFGRLIEAVSSNQQAIGIGLGEDTGVLISNGNQIEVIGSNLVIIVDGQHIKHNNSAKAKRGTALSIENVVMHVMAKGNIYKIDNRAFYPDLETLNHS